MYICIYIYMILIPFTLILFGIHAIKLTMTGDQDGNGSSSLEQSSASDLAKIGGMSEIESNNLGRAGEIPFGKQT